MTYRSTGIRHSEDGFDVDGELTLHGVTRQVTLALDVNGLARDPFGGTRAGFSATAATWPHMVPRSCSAPSTGAAWRRPPPASTRSAFDQAGRWRRWRQPPSWPVASDGRGAVRLWRSEQPRRPIAHLAGELGVHPEALRNRIRQDGANRGERGDGAARAVLAAELDASRTR